MTPEQEYNKLTTEVARLRSEYDVARGGLENVMALITKAHPEVATFEDAEFALHALQIEEENALELFTTALAEYREQFPGGNDGN